MRPLLLSLSCGGSASSSSYCTQRATELAWRRGFQITVIEADLEAFSPGRAAAHDGHGRLAEGERAF